MIKNPIIDALRLDGGVLCLDFVNTIPDRLDGTNRDNLKSFNDLIYWAKKAGILDGASLADLERIGNTNGKNARDFFSEAIGLRSLLYTLFQPISQKQKVKKNELEAFNHVIIKYFPYLEVIAQKDRFVHRWNFAGKHFYRVTGPIIKTAYELLLSDNLHRIKECPNCGWLFLDTTKNGRRRWCSMQDCGNNVKALEYYYRNKKL